MVKLSLWCASVSLLALAGLCIFPNNVNAAASDRYFPSPNDVAIYGPNSGLDGPYSHFRINATGGNVDVILENACVDQTSGSAGLRASIDGQTKDTNNNCSGGDDLIFRNVSPGRVLTVQKINGQGHQPFNVRANSRGAAINLNVTHLDNPNRYTSVYGSDGDRYGVNVWMGNGATFRFKAPCNHNGANRVYFKWKDADAGEYNQPGYPTIRFTERDPQGNQTWTRLVAPNRIGGNGAERYYPDYVFPGYSYTWEWSNTSSMNAIQHVLPYGDQPDIDCNEMPNATLSADCTNPYIRVNNLQDPDRPNQNVHIRITAAGRLVFDGYRQDDGHNFNYPSGLPTGTFDVVLRIYNLTPGGSEDGKSVVKTRRVVCGIAADQNCKIFKRDLQPHSRYRFTVFSTSNTANNFVAGSPSSTDVSNGTYNSWNDSGNLPKWKQFKAPNPSWNQQEIIQKQVKVTNGNDNPVSYQLDLPDPWGSGYVVYAERWYHYDSADTNPNLDRWRYFEARMVEANCYSANCESVNFYIPPGREVPGRPGAVQSGQWFRADITLHNTGRANLPANIGGYNLTATDGQAAGNSPYWTHAGLEYGINRGDSITANQWLEAKSPGNRYGLNPYPDYFGRFALGPGCSSYMDTYQPFDLHPSALDVSLLPDNEEPTSVRFDSRVDNTGSGVATATATRTLTKNGAPYASWDNPNPWTFINRTFGAPNDVAGMGSIDPGDEYCGRITISPAAGWVGGPGGNDQSVTDASRTDPGSNPSNVCDKTANKPYLRVYGTDVVAGSNFYNGTSCASGTSGINTYRSTRLDRSGSGVQFGALAHGAISGFRSAVIGPLASFNPPFALTFANTTGGDGGGYNANAICATDFFGATQINPGSGPNPLNLGSRADDQQTIYNTDLTINGSSLPANTKHTVYVDGNVFISGNITFGFRSSFALIVNGNIYISPEVNRLDGLYVAQGSSSGTINTCARNIGDNSFLSYDPPPTGCRSKLNINGAFVARKVKFLRTIDSLRNSCPREYTLPNTPNPICGITRAAEVFNFSPEMFLYPPPLFDPSETDGPYQFITTLPPIL